MSCHYMPYCDLECTGEITKECAEHMDGIVTVFLAVRRRDIGMLERSWGVAKKVVQCCECRMSDECEGSPTLVECRIFNALVPADWFCAFGAK